MTTILAVIFIILWCVGTVSLLFPSVGSRIHAEYLWFTKNNKKD